LVFGFSKLGKTYKLGKTFLARKNQHTVLTLKCMVLPLGKKPNK